VGGSAAPERTVEAAAVDGAVGRAGSSRPPESEHRVGKARNRLVGAGDGSVEGAAERVGTARAVAERVGTARGTACGDGKFRQPGSVVSLRARTWKNFGPARRYIEKFVLAGVVGGSPARMLLPVRRHLCMRAY
jgi:hypothetical protein